MCVIRTAEVAVTFFDVDIGEDRWCTRLPVAFDIAEMARRLPDGDIARGHCILVDVEP